MRATWRNPVLVLLGLLAGPALLCPAALAQQVEEVTEGPPRAKGPSKSDWVAAGLDPGEYEQALSYEVGIDEWKQLVRSRKNHTTAGWACVGVAALGGGVLATIYLAKGWGISGHPQMEVFAISMVGIGALLLTGFVVAFTKPGPEDFVQQWRKDRGLSFELGPTTLTPGIGGLELTF